MHLKLNGYLFPRNQRYLFETTLLLFILGFVVMLLVGILGGDDMRFVCYYGCLIDSIGIIFWMINNLKYRQLRFATYCLTDKQVSMKYGENELTFQRNEKFNISIVPLNISIGKAISVQPFIVFWRAAPPAENVNPFKLIKNGSFVLLPYQNDVLVQVMSWSCNSYIPQFPDYVTNHCHIS